MSIDEAIHQTLAAISSVAGRAYPLSALKNAEPDFVFYICREQDEQRALDGATGLREAVFEIHCVAATYARMVALSGDVQTALQRMQGAEVGGLLIEEAICRQATPDLLESNVSLYRRAYSLQIYYQEV